MYAGSPYAGAPYAGTPPPIIPVVTGSGSGSLKSIAGTGSGAVTVAGSGAGSLGAITGVGSGAVTVTGNGAGSLGSIVGSGFGSVAATGAGSGSLGSITGSGSGQVTVSGLGSGSLGRITGNGSGNATVTGNGSGSLAAITGSGSGAVVVAGVGSGSLGSLTGSGSGLVTITGVGSGSLGPITGSGSGTVGGDSNRLGTASLLVAVEQRLRSFLADPTGRVCGIQPDGKPPPGFGQLYYAVHWGRNDARQDATIAEAGDADHAISVTITARKGYSPQDSRGAVISTPDDLLDLAEAISGPGVIHGNYATLMNVANGAIAADVNGFIEPLLFGGYGPVREQPPRWVGSRYGPDVLTIEVRFAKARRLRV